MCAQVPEVKIKGTGILLVRQIAILRMFACSMWLEKIGTGNAGDLSSTDESTPPPPGALPPDVSFQFLREAKRLSKSWKSLSLAPESQPFNARKAAHFHCSTLQDFDPARPYSSSASIEGLPTVSPGLESENEMETKDEGAGAEAEVDAEADAGACAREPGLRAEPVRYDVVWCQWCLQHLSDADLISFLKRAKAALVSHPSPSPSPPAQTRVAGENENEREQVREPERYRDQGGVIVVKENVCQEEEDGSERVWYDDEDHSITR